MGIPNLQIPNGYGSIPINTIFSGMNIHKSQLFWCELQGYKVLTHCQMASPQRDLRSTGLPGREALGSPLMRRRTTESGTKRAKTWGIPGRLGDFSDVTDVTHKNSCNLSKKQVFAQIFGDFIIKHGALTTKIWIWPRKLTKNRRSIGRSAINIEI